MRIVPAAVLLMFFSLSVAGQSPLVPGPVISGTAFGAAIGFEIAVAGDVNGDGFDDIVAGNPYFTNSAAMISGQVMVYSGLNGSVLMSIPGNSGNMNTFGASVDGAGDVNNDGFDDIVVGAYRDGSAGSNAGACHVYSGMDGSLLYAFQGAASNFMGYQVAGVGDLNNDGFDDVGTTALGAGFTRIYSGQDGSVLHTVTDAGDLKVGLSVDGAGDCNGDGILDFVVGDSGSKASGITVGSAAVFSGADASLLFSVFGTVTGTEFGDRVAGLGDVNGDGFDDIGVSAFSASTSGFTNNGSIHVLSGMGGTLLFSSHGKASSELYGRDIEGAGDVDGDGQNDLVVAIPGDTAGFSTQNGAIEVLSGATGATITKIDAPYVGAQFGRSVAGGGDFNGDGLCDIAGGAIGVNGPSGSPGLIGNAGFIRTYVNDLEPASETYVTTNPIGHGLMLTWTADGNQPFSKTGTITCSGASPASFGIIAASLAKDDVMLFGSTPVVIDGSPTQLRQTCNFGFDNSGMMSEANISRIEPSIAGFYVYIQAFELAPGYPSSNGLSLLATM